MDEASVAADPAPAPARLTLEERFSLVRSVGEECVNGDELRGLLEDKENPVFYDRFEPSGKIHIAQGVMKTLYVNRLTSAGCTMKMWIADWFAFLNNKMGGDKEKIQTVGRYLIEVWKAMGMNLEQVEFLWASEEIGRSTEYWPLVMDIATKTALKRSIRCTQIMGRKEEDNLTVAQIMYPIMQCADVFFLEADICQLGMDQRKVNMLAREYCNATNREKKPVILSHHMLPGLGKGKAKMSKSDPSSAIFMDDTRAEVEAKIRQAYCEERIVENNPCLDYIRFVIIPWFGSFEVKRKEINGGNKAYPSMEELAVDYENGSLHPSDLKPSLTDALNKILQPVRDHFENNDEAKELQKTVEAYTNAAKTTVNTMLADTEVELAEEKMENKTETKNKNKNKRPKIEKIENETETLCLELAEVKARLAESEAERAKAQAQLARVRAAIDWAQADFLATIDRAEADFLARFPD